MNTPPVCACRWIRLCLGMALAASDPQARGGDRLIPPVSPLSINSATTLFSPPQGHVLNTPGIVGSPQLATPMAGAFQGPLSLHPQNSPVVQGSLTLAPGTLIQNSAPNVLSSSPPGPFASAEEIALPLSQNGQNLDVEVFQGLYQVTLQVWTSTGWKPIDTVHLNGGARTVRFAMPAGLALNTLRATGTSQNKFSAAQWTGSDTFIWQDDTQATGLLNIQSSQNFTVTGTAVLTLTSNATAFTNNATAVTSTTTTSTPEAVESDIWKVIGDRLFFFNQYRGLQVFDLKDPAHPVKTGSLHMAAVGEQFYALDDKGTGLALLAANNTRKQSTGSTIHLLAVSPEGTPSEVAQLPLDGAIADSRLLGTRLYVLLSFWDNDTSKGKVSLKGFELANPAAPVSLGTVDLPIGYYLHLQAAGSSLMVSSSLSGGWVDNDSGGRWDYNSPNNLSVLSVTGDGTPRLIKTVSTTGFLADQFSMDIEGDTLTAVSQAWAQGQPVAWGYGAVRQTWVETYSLSADGNSALARLKIDKADGEVLHATRFDGKRLYVVTFHRTDPLFIIDLTDPANLRITGELVTPGWSAYIEPRGDRLLAVGVEGGRVSVSWFDVSDVTSPKLLSRVYPGDGIHNTWSEATYDHKAVNWDQEAGKVFLPFQMWDYQAGGCTSATQVVNLANDTLTLGIAIKNTGTARRGTVINGCLASISGQQLVITTDPDIGDPKEIAWLELSWPVDRVAALDHYLMQVEDGSQNGWWGWLYTSTHEAVVRLSDKTDPDTVLDSVSLGQGSVIGMTQLGSRVYIAQMVQQDADHPSPQLRTWALDIDAAGKIQKQSAAAVILDSATLWRLNTGEAQAVWPNPTTLVWHVTAQAGCWWYPRLFISNAIIRVPLLGTEAVVSTQPASQAPTNACTLAPPPGDLCAMEFPVDVGSGLTAGSAVEVHIPADGRLGSVGKAFADQGFVYFSSQRSNQYYDGYYPYGISLNNVIYDAPGRLSPANRGCSGSLHVLDFRQGLDPVVRDPVSLSGLLLGVSNVDAEGAYLITGRAAGANADGSGRQKLTSLAYDGVRAHQIDAMDLNAWSAEDSAGSQVYLAMPAIDTSSTPANVVGVRLNAWTGRLERHGSWQMDATASSLRVVGSHLLASSCGDLEVAEIVSGDTLLPRASLDLSTNMRLNVQRSALDADTSGLWLPAGDYGVEHFSFTK